LNQIDIRSISRALNGQAQKYAIGKLQDIRAQLRGYARRPSSDIFTSHTIHDSWAFHYGGRKELQFNIGIEDIDGQEQFRWGVAFSFQLSQTLPSLGILVPKVRLFNDYVQLYAERFGDMRMWHYREGERSADNGVAPIPYELVASGVFAFLGKRAAFVPDIRVILQDFDRLLPLYIYAEGAGGDLIAEATPVFHFRPGCSVKLGRTVASHAERQLDVSLRHNLMQASLTKRLIANYGRDNVADEHPTGRGTLIDVVVRVGEGTFEFYEIKTAISAAACIRQALGQVMEYAYWPGNQEPRRIVICGEGELDKDGRAYLWSLKERFGLPLDYEQITFEEGTDAR
jgi:hypothetical protein